MASRTQHAGRGLASSRAHRPRPSGRRLTKFLVGLAVLVAGCVLTGWGLHHMFITGNCSSTGYNSYGPVRKCPSGFALWLMSAIFVGPPMALAGAAMTRFSGFGAPLFLAGIGAGLLTVSSDHTAVSGAKSAGLISGAVFLGLAALVLVRRIVRRARGPAGPGVSAAPASGAAPRPAPVVRATAPPVSAVPAPASPVPAAASSGPDPIDQIRRLAELRDAGALTPDEFDREKAKLLTQL